MIGINITGIDTMTGETLRKISGLFDAIATYNDSLQAPGERELAVRANAAFSNEAFAQTTQVEESPQTLTPAVPIGTGIGIEVDIHNLPWDGRIHSKSRAKNADGSWRMKRNVDESLVAKVTAELKQMMSAGTPVKVEVPEPPFAAPVETQSTDTPVPPVPIIPLPPTTPVTLTDGSAKIASPTNPANFSLLMQAITRGYTAKQITQAQVDAALAEVQLPTLPMLQQRPDLVMTVAQKLGITL